MSPTTNPSGDGTAYNQLIGTHECVLADLVHKPQKEEKKKTKDDPYCRAFVRAGAWAELHFDPAKVSAAIVTCGGLCPGLNNVVRELTNTLHYLYGIGGTVWGIRGGYLGFYDPMYPPLRLTPEVVENIHHDGGTILQSSRGGFDLDKIMAFLSQHSISQLYVIGGDGTHRGAFRVHEECVAKVRAQRSHFAFSFVVLLTLIDLYIYIYIYIVYVSASCLNV